MNVPIVNLTPCRLILIALLFCPQFSAAQYVELTAEIETVKWHRDGVSRTEPWKVRCVVGTNTWRMEGLFLRGAKSTSWFMGTNIIMNHELSCPAEKEQQLLDYKDQATAFVQVATPSGQRWTQRSESLDGNPGRAVRKPDLLTLQGRIAWLAFCSGPCLKREGRRLYPPSDLWKQLVSAPAGFADRTVVFDDALGLPKSVRLYATNNLPILQYGVVSSTNVGGWEFPLEFYLAQYRPSISADSRQIGPDGWEIDFMGKGMVTAIGPGSKPELPPEVKMPSER